MAEVVCEVVDEAVGGDDGWARVFSEVSRAVT